MFLKFRKKNSRGRKKSRMAFKWRKKIDELKGKDKIDFQKYWHKNDLLNRYMNEINEVDKRKNVITGKGISTSTTHINFLTYLNYSVDLFLLEIME